MTKLLKISLAVLFIIASASYAVEITPKSGVKENRHTYTVTSRAPQGSLDEIYNSTDVPMSIPDGEGIVSELNVPDTYTIGDVNCFVDITHTYDRDLIIILQAPGGAQDTLFNRRGGSGDNITDCTFDDEANNPIAAGSAPFTGSWRPEYPLSDFDGGTVGGLWFLFVSDNEAADTGLVNSWGIEVTEFSANVGHIYGIVTDIDTDDPVPGAQVELVQPGLEFCADQLGEFIVENIAIGQVTINVSHELYQDWTQTIQLDSGELELVEVNLTPREITFLNLTSNDGPVIIGDLDSALSYITVTESFSIYDVNCEVNISHTWDSDLDMWLEGPNGVRILLVFGAGTGQENFVDCVFDDESCQSIFEGTAPFTGVWRPTDSLSAFDTLNSQGEWTLIVADLAAQDSGQINDWTLHLSSESGVNADESPVALPTEVSFHGAYPNPFNATTTFSFDLNSATHIELTLFDLLGRNAATIHNGLLSAGNHEIKFDGGELASGVYVAALSTPQATVSQKVVLLK